MNMVCKLAACTALALGVTGQANAATFNFNMTYDGTALSLDAGSDVPNGTVLNAGDTFTVNLAAAGSDSWTVNSAYDFVFVPLSFLVDEFASRFADITTNFLNNGANAFTIVDTNTSQEYIHVGAQIWNLASGLEFDQVSLTWTLLSIDTLGPSTISAGPEFFNGFGAPDSPFFNSSKITYNVSAVPIPAALPLLLTAMIGMGALARKRRRERKAA